MGADKWSRVEDLFHQAVELAPADRSKFLECACGGDCELLRELQVLLDADAAEDGLLRGAVDRAIKQLPPESDEPAPQVGQRIGPYSITGLIGRGGMGEVYHAVREDDFRMPVAIKLLKRGGGTEMALRRFRIERQILAGFQHPNIGRLLDGGATASGLPYLVMEYIEGVPLLEYAAGLPVRERLRLFLAVCSAVQYAHQRHVVHRDIKPANILVTVDGIPKLLDFGIAKLLHPSTADRGPSPTAADNAVMTPEYASPEQIRGEPVTIATDIYSLGALLFEVLTGRQAPRPGNGEPAAHEMDAELAAILRKALRQQPKERYASVAELSDDVERFLQDRPVHAHKESLLYRCRKLLKRNRLPAAVAAATAVLSLALLAGLNRMGTPNRADTGMWSIAVLPFENSSGDPGQEYFADSMTDAVITELARIRSLRVISLTSVMPFKGGGRRLPEIARSLRVGAIAEGSVQRSGDRARITLRLVNAARDRQVWSGTFEREIRNVLALQRQAAAAVASEIRATLTDSDRVRASESPRVNVDAYETYLKGRHALFRSSVGDLQQSIQLFHQALGIDPRYALAYAGLAESYMTLSGMYLRPREAMPKAKAAAQRALELDSDLAEAHFIMGVIQGSYEFDWRRAEDEFKRALDLNPNNALAHLWYGQSLVATGRSHDGIEQVRIAHDLDPLSAFVETGLGQMYFLCGDYAQAIQQLRSVTESDVGFIESHTWLGVSYLYARQPAAAVRELERARQLDPRQTQSIAYLAYAHAKLGEREKAALLLRQLTDMSRTQHIPEYLFAIVSIGMNRNDAIDWLEKGYEERDDMLGWLKVDALLDPLRGEPRFQRLMKQMGLDSPVK
uniref:Serine/threonine protein kinase with TPR repeats n=1 Tax=Solibacter usitatus (strain Ellin6076) TaxID=234267 RepID=Q021X4_SOLUE